MQFVIGLVVGAAILWLVLWLHWKDVVIRWYEWLLAGLGFVLLVWAINDFFGSMATYNETAGRLFLLILGLPAVILLGLSVFFPLRRYLKKDGDTTQKVLSDHPTDA